MGTSLIFAKDQGRARFLRPFETPAKWGCPEFGSDLIPKGRHWETTFIGFQYIVWFNLRSVPILPDQIGEADNVEDKWPLK